MIEDRRDARHGHGAGTWQHTYDDGDNESTGGLAGSRSDSDIWRDASGTRHPFTSTCSCTARIGRQVIGGGELGEAEDRGSDPRQQALCGGGGQRSVCGLPAGRDIAVHACIWIIIVIDIDIAEQWRYNEGGGYMRVAVRRDGALELGARKRSVLRASARAEGA